MVVVVEGSFQAQSKRKNGLVANGMGSKDMIQDTS